MGIGLADFPTGDGDHFARNDNLNRFHLNNREDKFRTKTQQSVFMC